MQGTGTISKTADGGIQGILTWTLPGGDVLVVELTGTPLGSGIYQLRTEAKDELLRLAEKVLGGDISRVMG